jgi:uncharacterized flavoprotein (TIGR03862 family)
LKAAEVLAQAGVPVTVFEKMPSPARKFLMAGRGGLNLTHSEPLDGFLARYGEAAGWLDDAIGMLTPQDLRDWSVALGQPTFEGSSGRVFPESFKASPLLRAWLRRLDDSGVRLETRKTWTGWTSDSALAFADGTTFKPAVTVLALGGASWPRLGADGGWVGLLRDRGIQVNDLRASNAGIAVAWSQHTVERFAGAPLKRIALSVGQKMVAGEAMVSRTGLEGGAVYALSRCLREAADAAEGNPFEVRLDLKPGLEAGALAARLAKVPRKQSLTNRLRKGAGLSPQAISVWRDFTPKVPDDDADLAHSIKAVTLVSAGIQPLDRAISSAGGISRDELDEALMLHKLPGVFVRRDAGLGCTHRRVFAAGLFCHRQRSRTWCVGLAQNSNALPVMTRFGSFETPFDAVVIGATGGIGAAVCHLLQGDAGVGQVLALSRSSDPRLDLTDEATIEAAAARAAELSNLRLVFVATGLLHDGDDVQPEKALRHLAPDAMARNFAVNTMGPALVLKHFQPLLPRDGKAVFAAISARVGSISDNRIGGWYSYRASKAALNMMLKCAAIEIGRTRKHQIMLGLHPGTVDTGLSKPFQSNVPDGKLFSAEQSAGYMLDAIEGASPDQSGSVIDWDGKTVPA